MRDDVGTFAVVGAGAMASALAPALHAAGRRAVGVASKGSSRARILAQRIGCPVVALAGARADLVCCCVPDDAVSQVVETLARSAASWEGVHVLHTSGSRGSEVLEPLAARGAVTFAFHPIQTFVYPASEGDLTGVSVGVGGDARGLASALSLAEALGLSALPIDDARRSLYHLATAIASNGLVTLAAVARRCLERCEISVEDAERALGPLVAASGAHVERYGPDAALTGPVARGDVGTVMRHFEALRDGFAELLPLYAALTAETARLAVDSGRLGPDTAAELLSGVSAHLERLADDAEEGNNRVL